MPNYDGKPKSPDEIEKKIRELRDNIRFSEASIIERKAWLKCLKWVSGDI